MKMCFFCNLLITFDSADFYSTPLPVFPFHRFWARIRRLKGGTKSAEEKPSKHHGFSSAQVGGEAQITMTVGIARISFRLHGNESLKDKRRVVKSIVEKSRHRFNVSVAEVADQDVYQRAVIGVAVIGSDGRVLNSLLDRIIGFMDSLGLAEMIDSEIELIPLGS
jgi:uncharacterized protein YlxP (DUF503 family)